MTTATLGSNRLAAQERLRRFIPFIIAAIVFGIVPGFLPGYVQSIMTQVIVYALFAMSLDIIFGYTGLLSLGHAAFMGIGGYTAGILVYKLGIVNFWIIAPSGVVVATIAAVIIGFIALRMSGIYFLLVTFAMAQVVYSIVIKWTAWTRGFEGIVGIPPPVLGLPITWNHISLYYFILIIASICFFLLYKLVHSPFGEALQGIRENEPRMRALGYNTWLYKYLAFIIGGFFAGLSGVLYVSFTGMINSNQLSVTVSALAMLMCIIGGLGTLWGPVIGALVVVIIEFFASLYVPERWPMVLGAVFILVVLFLRGGIAPRMRKLWKSRQYGSPKG